MRPVCRFLLTGLSGLLPACVNQHVFQEPEGTAERVDAYMAPLVAMDLFSGTVLVARGGKVLVEKAWGFADAEHERPNTAVTGFKLMSTSKTFAGVTVMRLVQDGKLALTDPVGKHLPDWPEAWSTVTVHDLLDHTSAIPNLEVEWGLVSRSGKDRGLDVWRAFASKAARPLSGKPGTVSRYSNFNTVLAGCVAEAVTGRKYRELVQALVMEPAGMKATGFDDGARHDGLSVGFFRGLDGRPDPSEQDMSHIQPAGGLWSTVGDLYRFDRALRGDVLLEAAARTRMVTPRPGTFGYACCWANRPVHGHACIQHSGGANGYVADFLRFPDDDACVVVLSNYAFAPIIRISNDLAAILFDAPYQKPQPCEAALLDACAGVYGPAEGSRIVVRRCGSTLISFELSPGSERCGGRALVPVGGNRFVEAMGQGTLVFEPDAKPPRVRRVLGEHEVILQRCDDAHAAWQAAAGELTADPPLGKRQYFVNEAGRMWLRVEEGWPASVEIVPVDATVAMALMSFDFGTLLHRDGPQFRWHRADGRETRLERK